MSSRIPEQVADILKQVGLSFHHHVSSSSEGSQTLEALISRVVPLPYEVYENAALVLDPLVKALLKKEKEEWAELGEMLAADSETIEHLCQCIVFTIEGNLHP